MPQDHALAYAEPEASDLEAIEPEQPGTTFDLEIYMAFQPVIDTHTGTIHSQEALVRGPSGRSEATVMARVTPKNQFDFDRKCRVAAIETATALGLRDDLSINFMPSAVDDAEEFLQHMQWTADEFDFPVESILLEYSEVDRPVGIAQLKEICRLTRRTGIRTVIDDFGAGTASMLRLSALRPAVLKLDQTLVRKIDADARKRSIVASIQALCLDLGIDLIGKGVETVEEVKALQDCGLTLFQGNVIGEATLEKVQGLSDVHFPDA